MKTSSFILNATPYDLLQKLPHSWPESLRSEYAHHSELPQKLAQLGHFLELETRTHTVYPAPQNWFKALQAVPLSKVRVVLLGQDPYHGPNQAMGLSFAVPKELRIKPPSLKNILKELHADLNVSTPLPQFLKTFDTELTSWTQQGVLLLNTILTVQESTPLSHQNQGWEALTDALIRVINAHESHTVFWLWGATAQKKKTLITNPRHLVIESAHPSPLSARRGFFGSRPFSKTNSYLEQNGLAPINWLEETPYAFT